ncbi:MAG: hypothetical protein KF852_13390 [Saprospiraceae bacterium]|nr:hypothetical protein [Saprospiraceae bacterium]
MRPFLPLYYFSTFLVSLFFLSGCEKILDPCEEQLMNRSDAFHQVRFSCEPQIEDFYFTGMINGKRVCYYNGYDDYEARTGMWSRTVTDGPTLSPSTLPLSAARYLTFGIKPRKGLEDKKNLMASVVISSPAVPADSSWSYIAKKYLLPGQLALQNDMTGEKEGFNVSVEIPYRRAGSISGHFIVTAETAGGRQENSRLEVVEWETYSEFGWDYYRIVLEIECQLYGRDCYSQAADLRYRLTEGRLVMVVAVPE